MSVLVQSRGTVLGGEQELVVRTAGGIIRSLVKIGRLQRHGSTGVRIDDESVVMQHLDTAESIILAVMFCMGQGGLTGT